MTNKDLMLNQLEREIVYERRQIQGHVKFAAERVERAQASAADAMFKSAGNEILNVARNALDLAASVARLDELEKARRNLEG